MENARHKALELLNTVKYKWQVIPDYFRKGWLQFTALIRLITKG